MCASIEITQAFLIAAHFSNKMNKEEEGFAILNHGQLHDMKIDESFWTLAAAHCDAIYTPASRSYKQIQMYTHSFCFSIHHSAEVL